MKEKKEITIQFAMPYWLNFKSGKIIGATADKLVEYVNKNKLTVVNDDCFRDRNKFWYNK